MPTRSKTAEKPPEDVEAADGHLLDTITEANRIFGEDQVVRPVIVKLARIMEGLPELKPEGRNSHFGYGFIKDTQVSGTLRGRLAKERLMIIPDVVDESWVETPTQRGKSYVTKMKIHFTVIDGDSGDEVSGHGFGYGDDAGDKGANKAFTAALKYWLMKLFQIGGEDSEDDKSADERAAQRQAGTSQEQKDVKVEGATITGVQRGGRSDMATATQLRQVAALVKELDWTPEAFVGFAGQALDTTVQIPEEGDPGPAIKLWLQSLSADNAGKLITALVDAKDGDDGIPEEPNPSGY